MLKKTVCPRCGSDCENIGNGFMCNYCGCVFSPYHVFRRKDAWDRTESPAVAILDEECKNSRPLIRECVEKHIREYPFHELEKEEIGDVIYDVIMERILKPKGSGEK